jgi:nucleotidyltransferase AbiEii toxin of type IV toxin-antitoxin system
MHHPSVHLDEAVRELLELSRHDGGDRFTFVLGNAVAMTAGTTGASIRVEARLGTELFCQFSVDLSTELSLVTHVERVDPPPVLLLPEHGIGPLPQFALYPLPNQVADKVCALYEQHGSGISTRYRDLVDLALITASLELDAHLTHTALTTEAARRSLKLPRLLRSPGPGWDTNYRANARRSNLPSELHELTNALRAAGTCLNPLLAGEITTGTWDPHNRRWLSAHTAS